MRPSTSDPQFPADLVDFHVVLSLVGATVARMAQDEAAIHS